MFANLSEKFYAFVTGIPFNTLVIITWVSYAAIFVFALFACLFSGKVRKASKRPFMGFTNAFTAVTLALFLLEYDLSQSIITAVLFWAAGYLLYGALCLVSLKKDIQRAAAFQAAASDMPAPQPQTKPRAEINASVPAAKSSVRLEHAAAVTDKLLSKNLAKSDRQELEKLKNTLAVLQIKGTLTPTEAEILNDNFNALLKLMAKYNV